MAKHMSGSHSANVAAHARASGMPHVTTRHYQNGNQGFSEHSLGGDTIPGPGKGAPLSNSVQQTIDEKHVEPTGLNPFNQFEGNGQGVLGDKVVDQNAGRYTDSPVPREATLPRTDIVSKAAEVASFVGGSVGGYAGPQANNDQTISETFPKDGVLGRD